MKKILSLMTIWLIGLVVAHTGNDAIEHGMMWFDWILAILVVVVMGLIIVLIRRRKNGE